MKVGIIGAMNVEIENLKHSLNNVEVKTFSGIDYIHATLAGRDDIDVVAAICGAGKVNAAICAQTMILEYEVDQIINIGVGGGLTSDLKVFDVVVADKLCQHDIDCTSIGDPLGLISGINIVYLEADKKIASGIKAALQDFSVNCHVGTIATGDSFIAEPKQRQKIHDDFGAIAADMEGCAIAQVCYISKVPCGIIRSISDSDGAVDYLTFREKAADVAIKAVVKYMSKL